MGDIIKAAPAMLRMKHGMVYVPRGTPVGPPECRIGWAQAVYPGIALITVPPERDGDEEVVEFIRQGRGSEYMGWMRTTVASFKKEWTRA